MHIYCFVSFFLFCFCDCFVIVFIFFNITFAVCFAFVCFIFVRDTNTAFRVTYAFEEFGDSTKNISRIFLYNGDQIIVDINEVYPLYPSFYLSFFFLDLSLPPRAYLTHCRTWSMHFIPTILPSNARNFSF